MKSAQEEMGWRVGAKAPFAGLIARLTAWAAVAPRAEADSSGRFPLAAAVTLSFVWLAALCSLRPLMLPDEGRYVGVAWEMLRSGEWLTPTLDGLPFFHKPPLFYWITAGSMAVLGPSDFAARVAPMLGAWVAATASFLFVRRWWSERAARFALFGLLLQPLFFLGGQFANLDMLVAGCITATILLLAHAALSVERGLPYRTPLAAAYAAAGFGVLAKGLIGIVIPALVIGVWLLLLRRWRTVLALLWLPGGLLCAAIAAPWFMAMQARYPDFGEYFFFVQHVRRFAAGGFNNAEPFWFFAAVLLLLHVPWLPWLRSQFSLRRYLDPQRGEIRLLMAAWAVLVTLFFSFPESKLIGYILPALPPIAILAGDGFADPARRASRTERAWWSAAAIAGVAFSTALVIAVTLYPIASSREVAAAMRGAYRPDQPLFMLGGYYSDLPVYLRLKHPVGVVEAWTDPEIDRHDNWRKEFADAGRFAPLRAAKVLVEADRFPAALCAAPVSWVIGESSANRRFPLLDSVQLVATVRGTSLWRVDTTVTALAGEIGCGPDGRVR